MGIKITNEAPVGIKAGLRASYQWVNQDMLDAVGRQEWRKLLFVSCFLHSIVQVGGVGMGGGGQWGGLDWDADSQAQNGKALALKGLLSSKRAGALASA